MALKEDSKGYIYDLYKVLRDKEIIDKLRKARNSAEMKEIILENTIPTE